MPISTIKYTNPDITVVWEPGKCIHSKICWTELRAVFDPAKRPWVNMEGGNTEQIVAQIKKCPSGALSFFRNEDGKPSEKPEEKDVQGIAGNITQIEIKPNGPILIHTDCAIVHSNGETESRMGITALCRCGHSDKKPFCDGSHKKADFKG